MKPVLINTHTYPQKSSLKCFQTQNYEIHTPDNLRSQNPTQNGQQHRPGRRRGLVSKDYGTGHRRKFCHAVRFD